MKVRDKVKITKGRLKGEICTVIGTTDLNMDHRIIVSRHNPLARDTIMGFGEYKLALIEEKP